MALERPPRHRGRPFRVKGDYEIFVEPGAIVIHVKDYHPDLLRLGADELRELLAAVTGVQPVSGDDAGDPPRTR